jgi:hypothetical protein
VGRLATITAWALAPAIFVTMIFVTGPVNLMGDFRAFYCAGDAIAHGANPYLEEPLHACERRARTAILRGPIESVTLPAPLPPSALMLYVPLSRLPFPLAALMYGLLLIAAMSAAVALFARATGVSSLVLNLAFAAIAATQIYFLGQPMPFVFLAFAATALLVRRERWWAAAACMMFATIEPHLALPALAAMVVALPKTRLPILAGCALLGLASVLTVGLPTSIAYVRDVIPAHALSNAYEWQYSLTSILTSFGVDGNAAVRAGEAMYAAMVAVGVAIAYRLWKRTGDRAAVILVPPAFAVFGGVHVHQHQLAIAFPAILAIHAHYPRLRNLSATGMSLAMIPWNMMSSSVMTGFTPLLVGWFARSTMGARRGLVLTVIAAIIAISVLALALDGMGPGDSHYVVRSYPPGALAEQSWGDFSRAVLARQSLLMQWIRLPVLVGLALGLLALTRAAVGDSAVAGRVHEHDGGLRVAGKPMYADPTTS